MSSVVVERLGAFCVEVVLNRPKKLNALDLAMVQELTAAVGELRRATGCLTMVMRGEGGKAFCAGGDVASVRASGLAPEASTEEPLWSRFFREEYHLDATLGSLGSASSRIKQVSLWDGIVMGGGVGLSVHGRFRVATEKTKLAMPETAIGLFPDIGACKVLEAMPLSTGVYTALTGARLDAADVIYTGLATHFVPSQRLTPLLDALANLALPDEPSTADDLVAAVLEDHHVADCGASALEANAAAIDRCFSLPTVEAILDALDATPGSDFEAATAATLRTMSPTSLKISLEAIKRAHDASLFEVLRTDLRLAARCCDPTYPSDFYEGVRAVLVDKDRNPAWRATLEQVTPEDVDRFFRPLPHNIPELHLDNLAHP